MFKKETIKEVVKEIFVPIPFSDARTYAELWKDKEHLNNCKDLGNNYTFLVELFHALKTLRLLADSAGSPEELRGIQKGVGILQSIITIRERSERELNKTKQMEIYKNDGIDRDMGAC